MLQSYNTSESHWLGAHVNVRLKPKGFLHGGAGYLLSRKALEQLVLEVTLLAHLRQIIRRNTLLLRPRKGFMSRVCPVGRSLAIPTQFYIFYLQFVQNKQILTDSFVTGRVLFNLNLFFKGVLPFLLPRCLFLVFLLLLCKKVRITKICFIIIVHYIFSISIMILCL